MSLSGMMIKNVVVLLDEVNANLARGLDPYDALVEAGVSRLSPVVNAAGTTVLGVLPMLQNLFWVAMAVTIFFGLIVGTMMTMVVGPTLYALLYRIPAKSRNTWFRSGRFAIPLPEQQILHSPILSAELARWNGDFALRPPALGSSSANADRFPRSWRYALAVTPPRWYLPIVPHVSDAHGWPPPLELAEIQRCWSSNLASTGAGPAGTGVV
jgi:hypothetical protein